MEPLISIISVNYNQSGLTCLMIESLKNCSYKNIEIIVVDNASPDDNPLLIKEQYPDINLIVSHKNLGFAGGNNLGVEVARGKHVLFLNNDTEVHPGFLEPMVKILEDDPEIGMVSPKIIYHNTDDIIQYAGAVGINMITGRGSKIGHGEKDMGQYDQSRLTDLAHGAALMIPMKVIKEVGLMPDIFFLYYEEHDWCEMVKRAGYKVMYMALATVYHKESMSVGKNSPLKSYFMARNRLMFMRRNARGIRYLLSLAFFIMISFPKKIFTHGIKLEFQLLTTYVKGVLWNFSHGNVHQSPRLLESADGDYRIIDTYEHELVSF
ncbi:glycosyltransferase family 2 protein [Fulvivirgaceae bacterium BMA12]|uniref:Glycosyltransferase family 2 protein n=1 Tax=Agaribacillus aureus TaxID=3051825 RepID=A0ABT8L3S0_9BACT|nr:glycosyltransferase family 2 protein [Fulvivirgaceae bacterium BMA12]